jgi:iron complex transport system substrate-binding protein
MKRIWLRVVVSIALSLMMGASLLMMGGCQKAEPTGDEQATAPAPDPVTEEPSVDLSADRVITDDAGRSVTIPGIAVLKRVYYTGAPGEIYCFTLAPELAGGRTMEYTEAELAYLPPQMGSLPFLGTLSGGQQLNPEAIVAANIQIMISVTLAEITEADKSDADELQTQLGIPVVVLDGSLDNISTTYRKLGEILGREEQAEELAAYCEEKMAAVQAAVATIPEDKRITLYYAEGPEGLQTEPESSTHAQTFKIAGAINVAQVEAKGGKGMSDVSLEQVIAWNPSVIIAWDDVVRGGGDEIIRTDPNWASIKAVQDARVYTMPNTPFSWCDRPPAVNRFLGMQWVANMLYPDAYDVDMVEVTRDFYSRFYHADITDAQAKEILANSYPAR